MKAVVLGLLYCLSVSVGVCQPLTPKRVDINGTGLSIVLPDTSFEYIEKDDEGPQFVSKPLRAMIGLSTKMVSDPRPVEDLVRLWMQESSRPGSRIVFDTSAVLNSYPARIFKTVVGEKPGQEHGVFWSAIYDFNGKPLIVMGGYDMVNDELLADSYLQSLLSLQTQNTDSVNAIFKHRFSITTDYAPLRFAGYFLDGYIFSINGRGPNAVKETHCLVVPYNGIFLNDDEVINDLHVKRLLVHQKEGERVEKAFGAGTRSYLEKSVRYFYDAIELKDHDKIIFLGIVADQFGYFEIWGEAYGKNRMDFLPLFKKIAEGIKRDGD